MPGRIKKLVVCGSAILGLSGAGYLGFKACSKTRQPRDLAGQVIQAPRGIYHGAHLRHFVHPCFSQPFEQWTRQHLDISLRFLGFQDLSFPGREAEFMRDKGGALYLVLEPLSGKSSLPLERITKGGYTQKLAAFARQTKAFGGPLFLTFRPHFGSSYDAGSVEAAYQHIRSVMRGAGATNITWVWTAPLDGPLPQEVFADWISVAVFHSGETPSSILLEKLAHRINSLNKYGKPIMLEYGSWADPAQKQEFIKELMAKLGSLGVKAEVLYHLSRDKGSTVDILELNTPEQKEAYRKGLSARKADLAGPIITKSGAAKDRAGTGYPSNECRDLQGKYLTPAHYQEYRKLKKEIRKIKRRVRHPRDFSLKRIKLAKAYLALWRLLNQPGYLRAAERVIENADQKADEGLQYHRSKKYVRKYFEVLFAMAEVKRSGSDQPGAIRIYERIKKELVDKDLRASQQIHEYSVPGYTNLADLELGLIYLEDGEFATARPLLEEVRKWAIREGERYLASRASLGLARIALENGNDPEAILLAKQVINYPETRDIDLGIQALICVMRAYHQADPKTQKTRFNHELPWAELNDSNLKKALGIDQGMDLGSRVNDQWEVILEALSNSRLPDGHLKSDLAIIQSPARSTP